MHPQQSSIKAALDTLKKAHKAVTSQLSDETISAVLTRTQKNLENLINYLAILIDAEGINMGAAPAEESGPLTKIMGKDINPGPKVARPINEEVTKEIKKSAQQIAAEELGAIVDKLYPEFNNLEPDALIDTYSDLEIRGVAKRAGLPVTETNPKIVDVKFIGQIKEAITKKAELEKAGSPK